MQLYFFLLVVLSFSCASMPAVETSLERSTFATLCMLSALIVLCHIAARICSKQVVVQQVDPQLGAKLLERQMTAFRWLGLGIVLLCLAGFGLATATVEATHLNNSLALQAVVLLAPGLTITLATWSAEHYYYGLTGLVNNNAWTHTTFLWKCFRGTIAWLIVPILLLLVMSDLIASLPMDDTLAAMITAFSLLPFVLLATPWLIRHLFKTSRLDELTEQWIDQIMTGSGLKRTRIVRWDTGNRSFNAMVAGFIPPLRTLMISDRALDELPRSQVAMVVLHEAAHLRRFHVPLRMATIVPAWLLGGLITRLADGHSWAMAAGSVVAITITLITLRIAAIRTEFDADLQACILAVNMADRIADVPITYDEASDALRDALLHITLESPSAQNASWLHPSISERVTAMKRSLVTKESLATRDIDKLKPPTIMNPT